MKKHFAGFAALLIVLAQAGFTTEFSSAAKGPSCLDDGVPYAAISVDDRTGVVSHTATFDSQYSLACEGEIIDFSWTFSDGTTDSGDVVSHTFGAGEWTATLQITNTAGLVDSVSTTIDVRAQNAAPDAQDDEATFNTRYRTNDQSSATYYNLHNNDTDADGDFLSYSIATPTQNGTIEMTTSGAATYTPNPGFFGVDTFTYSVDDGYGSTDTASVDITVQWANFLGTYANRDYVDANEDETVTIDVLANDTDGDDDPLTVTIVSYDESLGNAWVNPDNTITFALEGNIPFAWNTHINYTASDPYGASASSIASITIQPVNDAPVAVDDDITVDEDSGVSFFVHTNDTDVDSNSLSPTLVDGPQHGTLTQLSGGKFVYIPDANYHGSDNFTYYSTDDDGADSNIATVNITVVSVNDLPTAGNDSASLLEDGTVNVSVLDNDSDLESASLTTVITTSPQHGNANVNPDGTITYTPDANYNGYDSLVYTVTDDDGGQATATLSLHIASVNDGPQAGLSEAYISKKTGYEFDASSSIDIDGTIVAYTFDFDDGTSVTTTNPVIRHKYKGKSLTRIVTVTVTDNEGATSTTSIQI